MCLVRLGKARFVPFLLVCRLEEGKSSKKEMG